MKIGNRVKIVKTEYLTPKLSVGKTGTVLDYCNVSGVVLVSMDSGYTPYHFDSAKAQLFEAVGLRCDGWNFLAEELEVIVDNVEAVA